MTGATPGRDGEAAPRRQDGRQDRAGELGGVVFRKVEPGGGYTVSSAGHRRRRRVRVFSNKPQPPDKSVYDQTLRRRLRLPDDPRRDEARDQRPPARARPRTAPTRRWSSTRATATRDPAPGERHPAGRRAARLRGRRRQHARHRLLGRRLRLLRAAAGARRLRRRSRPSPASPGSRNGKVGMIGRLLRRHQPALRRRHQAAAAWRRSRRCR